LIQRWFEQDQYGINCDLICDNVQTTAFNSKLELRTLNWIRANEGSFHSHQASKSSLSSGYFKMTTSIRKKVLKEVKRNKNKVSFGSATVSKT